ncbi:alkaline phosphatase family protein [Hymenobacter terrenus]|uniref:alkaline phosphatase family protein n=1 Tax=Hymenobacter terrenus TaxID=1629124 RepID=UPI00069812BD|nr:alkaline phosphatase family protein [Hymenobacter terrenus]
MKKIFALVLAASLSSPAFAQTSKSRTASVANGSAKKNTASVLVRPQLVVGIVVDQMRYDYLYRYWQKFGAGGFKRLLGEGFSFESCHYNYVPTYTGPGHASIYTGATPSVNGIVGNNWFEREAGKATYVTEDKTVQSVGGTGAAGQQSPRHMMTTTITDELRLATNFRSKVIGVCIKDRGSILPAGHSANAAYWYDGGNGNFISSTFYQKALPDWVVKFNQRGLAAKYLSQPWNTLRPLAEYTESAPDNVSWEAAYKGEANPVFPHDLPSISGVPAAARKDNRPGPANQTAADGKNASATPQVGASTANAATPNLGLLPSTPFGNSITTDLALEAIRAEQLGQRDITDFLALSYSSTDYVGHQFGPNSIEVEDTYLRLDQELARLFNYLDQTVGRGQALVFLTADHGAAHSPEFLRAHSLPAGAVGTSVMRDTLQNRLVRRHGPGNWILDFENQQVYLNRQLAAQKNVKLADLAEEVVQVMVHQPGVSRALTAEDIQKSHWESGTLMYLENGYYPKRCGDVLVVLEPGWYESYTYPASKGTTHGASWAYDTHVPLLFWGWHVKHGESVAPVNVVDIAATVARFLHIQEPSGCSGVPLAEVLK